MYQLQMKIKHKSSKHIAQYTSSLLNITNKFRRYDFFVDINFLMFVVDF
jgi:hypothetical protein